MKVINHRVAPREKNQNGSAVQRCWVTVARANAVKNVWVRIAQIGARNRANTNFTHRVGTRCLLAGGARRVVGTTYGATFTPRDIFRPRTIPALRFIISAMLSQNQDQEEERAL